MILRWGRFGQFYACTGFPECKNTRPLGDEAAQPQTTDEKCDVCESPMVVKRGRFGQFLACSRYPECKGSRPILKKVGVPCPKDGGEIVEKRTQARPHVLRLRQLPELRLHELVAPADESPARRAAA